MVSRQSQAALLSLVVLLAVQSVGAFQTSSRTTWQSSQARKDPASERQIVSLTECASTRAQQSEKVEETNFLMKQFTTASGEVVYVLFFVVLKVCFVSNNRNQKLTFGPIFFEFAEIHTKFSKYPEKRNEKRSEKNTGPYQRNSIRTLYNTANTFPEIGKSILL